MLSDFVIRALLGGLGIALVAGPLGCFVSWRRMAYFGDTMAHGAVLGVAFGFSLSLPPLVGVLVVTLALAGLLARMTRSRALGADTALGVMAHSSLALGLVLVALMGIRVDLMGLLFGDVLALSRGDLAWIWGGALVELSLLIVLWRPLLASTVDEDLARAEGIPADKLRLVLMLLVALVVALAMKVVGVLLVTALMLIPAATARAWARTPEAMAVGAALIGATAVVLGLLASLEWDTPAGPSIVVGALTLFVMGGLSRRGWALRRESKMSI
ncbi:MAG: metal ABC transporter permease [Rhodospirillum sp.]|nr:metal ABC transporter permease [Rhodospirillum sp.]MCF8487804.1 metal ABC transporter permease [Rhodospirillum sp.]MCF8499902.1 metal ABC transporter permease [Rhodospirillum sp.]